MTQGRDEPIDEPTVRLPAEPASGGNLPTITDGPRPRETPTEPAPTEGADPLAKTTDHAPPGDADVTVSEEAPPTGSDPLGATVPENLPATSAPTKLGSAAPSSLHASGIRDGASVSGKLFDRGKYEILKEIARGGMGVVYKARQRDLNRVVALKVMLSGAHASPSEKQRFLREAEASAKLKHPHIVPVYDIGEESGNLFFTMDFVEGAPLSAKKKEFDRAKLLDVMIKICDGVAYAHMRGIIHRDLKPPNVMIDKNSEPLIMDFGLAKQTETDEGGKLSQNTREGSVMGTPHYMPPEQAMGLISEIDVRADVYALGVIIYELWTGKLPFNASSFAKLIHLITDMEPVPPRQHDPSVPWEIEAIALKAMEKQKVKRYDSALDLKRDLERFRDGLPILAKKATAVYRARRFLWRNRFAVGAGVAVVSFLSAAGVMAWRKQTEAARVAAQKLAEDLERAERALAEATAAVGGLERELASTRAVPAEKRLAGATAALSGPARVARQGVDELLKTTLILDAANARAKELRGDATRLEEKTALATRELEKLKSDEEAIERQLGAAAAALAQAEAHHEAKKLDLALASLEKGRDAALGAVGLGAGERATGRLKTILDLTARVQASINDARALEEGERAHGVGRASLDDARRLAREGKLDEARSKARTAVESFGAAKRVSAFERKGQDGEREARSLVVEVLIQQRKFSDATDEIERFGKSTEDALAVEAAQKALADAQGVAEQQKKRLAGLSSRVEEAERAGTEEQGAAAEGEVAAFTASEKKLSDELKARTQDLAKRAAFVKLSGRARSAERRARELPEAASKPDVAAGLWEAAAGAFVVAAREAASPASSEDEARRCRAEAGSVRLDAARLLSERDPNAARKQAEQAAATFASIKDTARESEARALIDELQKLGGTPEGMILWKGMANVELGGGPDDKNLTRTEKEIRPFYVAKRETTNTEFYELFVKKGGYAEKAWWTDGRLGTEFKDQTGLPGPAFWSNGRFADGDGAKPVVGISWYEARAFARSQKKRLLSDVEWEAVARYPDSRRPPRTYPWGEWADAWQEVFGARAARAIGPEGACPRDVASIGKDRCHDLGGNVSEWVDLDDPRASGLTPDALERVLDANGPRGSVRGGSFLTPFPDLARATHRFLPRKDARTVCVGVRLAKSLSGTATEDGK